MAILTVGPSGRDYTTIQAAINAASRGDTIVVQHGQTYTENVVLRYKASGTGYITIESEAMASLPAAGNRVFPSDAANMPTIRSTSAGSTWTISTELTGGGNPASHYILRGLQILRHNSTSHQYEIITLGYNAYQQEVESEIPDDFIIDRCLIRGADNAETRRGISLHASNTQIINSYIDNIWEDGADSQAIWMNNGPGPHLIGNNFLEAGSENILTSGTGTNIDSMVPENVIIEHNHFYKRMAWRGASPGRQIKNLFELKSGDNITVRNNIFENVWTHAQTGNAIVLTPRGENSNHRLQNVTFEYNIIRNCGEGIRIQTEDNYDSTPPFHGLTIRNNLIIVDQDEYDGQGFTILIGKGGSQTVNDWDISHNTGIKISDGRFIQLSQSAGAFINGLNIAANIDAGAGDYLGDICEASCGSSALTAAAGATWTATDNVLQRTHGSSGYPSGNYYPSTLSAIGFTNYGSSNFLLTNESTYKGIAPGGLDPGVNWAELQARTQYVEAGTNYGGEEPPPEPPPVTILAGPGGAMLIDATGRPLMG